MKVIIVAAGSGRRLMPFTKDCPKCLLQIGNKRIIDFTLEVLSSLNLKDIVMVVGHKKEEVKKYLGDRVTYVTNPIYNKTNSMYSLWCARDHFEEGFIYLHSDIIFEKAILAKLISCQEDICLSVDEKLVDEEDMKVRMEGNLIKEINKSLSAKNAKGEFIGIAKFDKESIKHLKEALDHLVKDENNYNFYFEYAVEHLIKTGHKIGASLTKNSYYAEVDYEKDIIKATNDILEGRKLLK